MEKEKGKRRKGKAEGKVCLGLDRLSRSGPGYDLKLHPFQDWWRLKKAKNAETSRLAPVFVF